MVTSFEEIYHLVDRVITYVPIINTCTLVIGLIGNVIACTVILNSKSFHTLTGFYLLSLSTSDLLILTTGILYSIYLYKIELIDHKKADYIMEWIFQTSVMVSTLTVTAFTVERYLAICHPFFVQSMSKKSRVKRIIVAIWSISAVLAVLPVAQIFIERHVENEYMQQVNENVMQYIADVWAVLYFFTPVFVMIVMFALIWLRLKKRSSGKHIAPQADRADTQVMLMFVVIVAIFFLSWGPYYIYRLLANHMIIAKYRSLPDDEDLAIFMNKIFLVNLLQQVTYPLSAALNPVIYIMMSKTFREMSKDLFSRTSRSLIEWSSTFSSSKIKLSNIVETRF